MLQLCEEYASSPDVSVQGSDTVSVRRPDGTVVTDEHAITLVDEVT